MRRRRGDLRVRFVRAAAGEALFLLPAALVFVAVLFFVVVLFADEDGAEDLVVDGAEA